MMRTAAIIAGAISGVLWWWLSTLLGANEMKLLGSHAWMGPAAGAITGIAIAALSWPVYKRWSVKALLWFSPLTVYIATAIYGFTIFMMREAVRDFQAGEIHWAVGAQSIVSMWYGITILVPIALAVHVPAYINHRVLRRVLLSASGRTEQPQHPEQPAQS